MIIVAEEVGAMPVGGNFGPSLCGMIIRDLGMDLLGESVGGGRGEGSQDLLGGFS